MLNALTLAQLCEIVRGELSTIKADGLVRNVSKDTRTLSAGDLYVAIKGDNFDGHKFIDDAQVKGAVAALVETIDQSCSLPQIKVEDGVQALALLAEFNRQNFNGPVVAITGSVGKTTTKELTSAVLKQEFKTLTTQGNLNNHIGAPLTALELSPEHTAAVIELGASAVGEIAANAQWLKPNVAIITNAAAAHLEGFGSLEKIVTTKGELLDFIHPQGTAILNADDANSTAWLKRALTNKVANILMFGFSAEADVRAEHVECSFAGCRFGLIYRGQRRWVNLPLLGEHNVSNALAAAAAGFALSLTFEQVVKGLESAVAVAGRLQSIAGAQGQTILNDSYNANPTSVLAALEVLKKAKHSWLVLGDMAELSAKEDEEHKKIGQQAKAQNIQHLLATGPLSKYAVAGFGVGAEWFSSKQELVKYLQENTQENDVILVKGSRSAGMEEIVEQLQHKTKVG